MIARIFALLVLCHLPTNGAAGEISGVDKRPPEQTDADPSATPPANKAALSQQLDQIVNRAIDARLLRSATSEDLQPTTPAGTRNRTCGQVDPFDFSAVETVSGFADLARFEPKAEDEGSGLVSQGRTDRIKAYLALGLNSEAIVALRRWPADDAEPLVQIARLMERRHLADAAYFASQTTCHETARLWLAAALLADGQQEGSKLLAGQMSRFRQLPIRLRADVAMISIPALAEFGERDLMQKILAAFPESDIKSISRLQFCRAIVDLSEGKADADVAVRRFLMKPEFEVDALSALRRHKEPLHPTQRAILTEDVARIVSHQKSMRQIAFATNFALDEMDAAANYDMILRLAVLPALQQPAARDEILRRLTDALRRDLESDEAIRKLIAIDVLMTHEDLFIGYPHLDQVYDLARRESNSLGRRALSIQLAERSGQSSELAEQQASVAFSKGDDSTLYALAARDAANQQVLLFAAVRAVRSGDALRLSALEPSLELSPETLLTLIEEDAIAQTWVVPESIYEAAGLLTDPEEVKRVARVLAIRAGANAAAPEVKNRPVTDVPAALGESRRTLATLKPEAP